MEGDEVKNRNHGYWRNTGSLFLGMMMTFLVYYGSIYMIEVWPVQEVDTESVPDTTNLNENQHNIVMTQRGFEPSEITIQKGAEVIFTTDVDRPFWPASNLHPSHEIYDEFDPKQPVEPDKSWSFRFDKVGVWEMHDHIRSHFKGTITVEE